MITFLAPPTMCVCSVFRCEESCTFSNDIYINFIPFQIYWILFSCNSDIFIIYKVFRLKLLLFLQNVRELNRILISKLNSTSNKSLIATTSTLSLLKDSLNTILPILPKPFIPNFTFDILITFFVYLNFYFKV
jgi:hypothetical protein